MHREDVAIETRSGALIFTRLYTSAALRDAHAPQPAAERARKRALAVIAHPYKLLGGSQNDPVVTSIARALTAAGDACIDAVTFDYTSTGLTTAQSRRDFVQVLEHYLPLGTIQSETAEIDHTGSGCGYGKLLLIGYSYGTLCLPPLDMLPIAARQLDVRCVLVSPLAWPVAFALSFSRGSYDHVRAFARCASPPSMPPPPPPPQGSEPSAEVATKNAVLCLWGTMDQFSADDKLAREWVDQPGVEVKRYADVDHFYAADPAHLAALTGDVVRFCTA